MTKFIVHILSICIIVSLLNVIYQVFYTYPYHNGQPVLFIPPLNYPVFVIITFVIDFISSKYIMKTNWLWGLFLAFIMALTFHYSTTFIQNKYTYLYDHYYTKSPSTNLTYLKDYEKQIDNRLTLGKALKEEGIKVESIESGYTDKGHEVSSPKAYQKRLYYVNDDLYIIFDWDERKITA